MRTNKHTILIRPIKLHYFKPKKSDNSTGIRESPSSQFLQLAPYVFFKLHYQRDMYNSTYDIANMFMTFFCH